MVKKIDSTNLSQKQTRELAIIAVYIAIAVLCAIVIFSLWLSATLSLCGISGCSGGGFGISYNPSSVQTSLIQSGLVAAITPALFIIRTKHKLRWVIITIIIALAIPWIGSAYIGAGSDGYPIHHIVQSF